MAAAPEASASAKSSGFKHDAFLSFSGEDTRTTFTTDLFRALKAADLKPFMDDDGIKRGNTITSELEEAIQNSRVSIIIFSENFASSSWCLDELLYIFDQYRSKTKNHGILPLFYHVDPSIMWLIDEADEKRENPFKKALDEHEKRFGKEKVDQWRGALRDFIDDIVKTTGKEFGIFVKEASEFKYDVLLSYESTDNHENFIELLDGELRSSKFIPFKTEDNGMDREEDGTSELDAAISRSRSSIIVFSRNYAYSPRCLDQLLKIFEYSSETKRLVIIPVFYQVSKDQVRMQAERLDASLPGIYNKQFKRENVKRWKEAIKGVAELPAAVAFSDAATK
ncbi:hypothetical protein RJ640_000916, partial [Escallonia rubra]